MKNCSAASISWTSLSSSAKTTAANATKTKRDWKKEIRLSLFTVFIDFIKKTLNLTLTKTLNILREKVSDGANKRGSCEWFDAGWGESIYTSSSSWHLNTVCVQFYHKCKFVSAPPDVGGCFAAVLRYWNSRFMRWSRWTGIYLAHKSMLVTSITWIYLGWWYSYQSETYTGSIYVYPSMANVYWCGLIINILNISFQ